MDQKKREEFRDIVKEAMARKSWTSTKVAEESGLTLTTITKITEARPVSPTTMLKVRDALGIAPLGQAQAEEGYSIDVELVRDTIGLVMRDLPESDRPAFTRDIFEVALNRPEKTTEESSPVE